MRSASVAWLWVLLALAAPSAAHALGSSTAGSDGTGRADVSAPPICDDPTATAGEASNVTPASGRRASGSRSARARRENRNAARAKRRRGRDASSKSSRRAAGARRATLTLDLDNEQTVTSAAFGRSTDPQPLTLVYRVSGCRVDDTLTPPDSPLPTSPVKASGAERPLFLPHGAVQIDSVEADGNLYVLHLRVFVSSSQSDQPAATVTPSTAAASTGGEAATQPPPVSDATSSAASAGAQTPGPAESPRFVRDFDLRPGQYASFVRIKAGWLHTVATPITVTRSEDKWRVPLGIGFLGAAAGFSLFFLLRVIHKDDLLIDEWWVLLGAAVVSVTVGAGSAYFTNYWNQDVWTWQDNGLALFTAAVSASTAGVAAALLAGIYRSTSGASEPAKEKKKAKARAKTATSKATTLGQSEQQVVTARSEPSTVPGSTSTQQPPKA